MTRADVNNDINSKITSKTTSGSLTNTDDGANRVLMMDYVDQQAPVLTSGNIDLTATPQVLPYSINSCTFTGGKAYLPTTTVIGKEVYVIAVSNNIEIRANVANTAKLFSVFNTFVSSITLTTNQMYRFTYIGFDTEGYWKAELI